MGGKASKLVPAMVQWSLRFQHQWVRESERARQRLLGTASIDRIEGSKGGGSRASVYQNWLLAPHHWQGPRVTPRPPGRAVSQERWPKDRKRGVTTECCHRRHHQEPDTDQAEVLQAQSPIPTSQRRVRDKTNSIIWWSNPQLQVLVKDHTSFIQPLGNWDGCLRPLVLARRATRPRGEWEYSVFASICWA
jgi:hypothetical protein